jgi:hypothetical protein
MFDAAEAGDYGPAFDSFAENIIVENGPGSGPGVTPKAETSASGQSAPCNRSTRIRRAF